MKITITEMRNTLEEINSRLDEVEDRNNNQQFKAAEMPNQNS